MHSFALSSMYTLYFGPCTPLPLRPRMFCTSIQVHLALSPTHILRSAPCTVCTVVQSPKSYPGPCAPLHFRPCGVPVLPVMRAAPTFFTNGHLPLEAPSKPTAFSPAPDSSRESAGWELEMQTEHSCETQGPPCTARRCWLLPKQHAPRPQGRPCPARPCCGSARAAWVAGSAGRVVRRALS